MHGARTDRQLPLPLPHEGWDEVSLRNAYRSARLRVPFEVAMRDRALAICLRCLSEAKRQARRDALQLRRGDRVPAEDLFLPG